MFDFRNGHIETIRKEIQESANNFRQEKKPNWRRVEVGDVSPGLGPNRWEIDFCDSDGGWHRVSFQRQPRANDKWYREEIARQVGDN
jgi:hypothetical protein